MHNSVKVIDHPLVQHKLTLLRDKSTPTVYFRQIIKEISYLMAYELTRDLPLTSREIETPLMPMQAPAIAGKKLALVSILRAGNGFLDGLSEVIPNARIGFVGMYRDEESLKPVEYYTNLPAHLGQREVIVVDPMLATGGSSAAAIDLVKSYGAKSIRFLSLLAAPEGIEHLSNAHPDLQIYTAAIDTKLNEKGYILPGLGDAGDRTFGTKVG